MDFTSCFLWYRSDLLGFLESCWSRNSPIHKIAGHADVCSDCSRVAHHSEMRFVFGKLPEISPMVRTPLRTMLQFQIWCFPELASPLDSLLSVSITYNIPSKKSRVFVYILRFPQSTPLSSGDLHNSDVPGGTVPVSLPVPGDPGPGGGIFQFVGITTYFPRENPHTGPREKKRPGATKT